VRPDSPLKLFTGQTISLDEFDKDYEFLGFNAFPPETLIVVSSAQDLVCEWRFVVVQNRVVAGSQYKEGQQIVSLPVNENAAIAFAKQVVASGFSPDPVWVLDVGRLSDGSYHVIEAGGSSFSGLYACNKEDVVREVTKVAISLHASSTSKSNK
jgi:hypothetical protein